DKARRFPPELSKRDGVDLASTQSEPDRQIVEKVPLRLEAKHGREQLVALRLCVPVHVRPSDRLHWDVRDASKPIALPEKAKDRTNKNQVLVDRLWSEMMTSRSGRSGSPSSSGAAGRLSRRSLSTVCSSGAKTSRS